MDRQLAECRRELENEKREKEEVQRKANLDAMRLRQLLEEQQGNSTAEKDSRGAGAAAAGSSGAGAVGSGHGVVSMDEHQQLHRKCATADARIRQLEQYIKDQSVKQARADSQHNEKDEEIKKLRLAVVSSSAELAKNVTERQAMQAYQNQLIHCLETGMRRVLSTAEQLLGEASLEEGHFGRTATKLSLTLSHGKEGEVSNLQRLLKDALRNNGGNKEAKAAKRKEAAIAKELHPPVATEEAEEAPSQNAVAADATPISEAASASGSVLVMPPLSGQPSMSNTSSRETSPGSSSRTSPRRNSAIFEISSRLVGDIRQLLTVSRQQGPVQSLLGGSPAERAKIQSLIDSVAPARKDVARDIITIEKILRVLDRDLRTQCEQLLGQEELESVEAETPEMAQVDALSAEVQEEAASRLPLLQDSQLFGLVSLRNAQQRSSSALDEFVELPQKLKVVFDLTKLLSSELSRLVSPQQSQVCSGSAEQLQKHPGEVLPAICKPVSGDFEKTPDLAKEAQASPVESNL
jgi:hypothetical protein